jgi:hypothetical protein
LSQKSNRQDIMRINIDKSKEKDLQLAIEVAKKLLVVERLEVCRLHKHCGEIK